MYRHRMQQGGGKHRLAVSAESAPCESALGSLAGLLVTRTLVNASFDAARADDGGSL